METITRVVVLTGTTDEVTQAIADLQSNIDYDKLDVLAVDVTDRLPYHLRVDVEAVAQVATEEIGRL